MILITIGGDDLIAARVNHKGEENRNSQGTLMKIVEFKNCANIIVEFQDEYKYRTSATYQNFIRGVMKNPYDKTIAGVGFLGVGRHMAWINNGRTPTQQYSIWKAILHRCYNSNLRYVNSAYEDCEVCKLWHDFQVFADWYESNYYDIGTERLHIDKDILIKGNKIYSPETCLLVPQRINMIFMTKAKNRDADLPNAIYRCKKGYQAAYGGKSLGVFRTLNEAISEHDRMKRIHIKQVVNEYIKILPSETHKALINW